MEYRVAVDGSGGFDYVLVFVPENEALTVEHALSLAAQYVTFDCPEAWKFSDAEQYKVHTRHGMGEDGGDEYVVTYRLAESVEHPVWARDRDLPW